MLDVQALFAGQALAGLWQLPTAHLARQVVVFARTDSTNSRALSLAGRPDCAGLALLADEQSAGRGQQGRAWVAPPRSSVLLSLLLFPPPVLLRPVVLTALSAVAVCRLVAERTGHPPRIKWPNDVLVAGRKIAGILIEQATRGPSPAVVIGIGLNVAQTPAHLAAAGLAHATSLHACGDTAADRDEVARRLLRLLDEEYGRLVGGDMHSLEAPWRAHLALSGTEVVLETTDRVHAGRIETIGFAGLTLRPAHGEPLRLSAEAIRHIDPHPPIR